MILGEFNQRGELFFEVGLIDNDGDIINVNALLDTGFSGWLAMDNQDAESLGWLRDSDLREMQTAKGKALFNIYEGDVLIDEERFAVEVLGSHQIENILLGVLWLRTKKLVVDFSAGVLTLG